MALYPNTPFASGDAWTPELAYESFQVPVFDDQPQYLGHRFRLLDSELSNTAGQIKQRVAAIEDGVKVTVESGLSLRYASGVVRLPSGLLQTITTGLVAAPNNATSFVYVDQTGAIGCATQAPVVRVLLARVTTVAGAVSLLEDLRHPQVRNILPVTSAIRVFGGSNTTDKTCTNGEVLDQGIYYFRDFTVPSGVTVTIDKFARIVCSGNVSIVGTINVTQATGGGGSLNIANAAGTSILHGGLTGGGFGAGSGFTGGTAYSWVLASQGSGGASGRISSSNAVNGVLAGGGAGGGGLLIEASGTISVTGTITARGSNGSTATAGNFTTSDSATKVSGGGGGSGGLISLQSLISVVVSGTATLDVRGGAGGNGGSVGFGGNGGSGGGGGWVVAISPTAPNLTGATVLLTGGAIGTGNDTSGAPLAGGAGGGFGGAGGNSGVAGTNGQLVTRTLLPVA